MTKHVQCPHCGQAYALTEEQVPRYAGQDISCTQCGESFLVSQDHAMTGGLATEPSAFQTQPEATAAAFPPPFAPKMAYGYAGASAAAATPSTLSQSDVFDAPTPYRFDRAKSAPARDTNGWAIAAIVCAVIGLIVPIVPGLLAMLFGTTAMRRMRPTQSGGGLAIGGITIGAMSLILHGSLLYSYVLPRYNIKLPSFSLPSLASLGSGGGSGNSVSPEVRCVENLKKLGEGMRQYAAANGGRFPDRLESAVIAKNIRVELLVCPASGDTVAPGDNPAAQAQSLRDGKHVSYNYVGQNLTASSPAECVLIYESPGRHGTGMHVLFVDGRVQTIGDVEAAKALNRLNRGVNPPWTRN
jgi:predicted Zn finger-like uncharacterized protein/prepilin-type processing-associated H-X9-DG protein